MSSKKRLMENIVSLFTLQGANYLLPLITIPYLVRVLGPDKYGLLAFSAAFIQYFNIVTDYGFNLTATRRIAINREDQKKVSVIFSSVMLIKFVLLILCFIAMAVIVFVIPKFRVDWLFYMINFLAVFGNMLFPIWYYQGIEKMKYITVFNITAKIISTISIFVFVKEQSDYLLTVFIQSSSLIFVGGASLWVALRGIPINTPWRFDWNEMMNELKEGAQVFIATISGNVYGQGAVIITGLLAGQTSAGYYSIAKSISGAVVGLVQPIAQAIYPYLCNLFRTNINKYLITKRYVKIFGVTVGILLGSLIFVYSGLICKLVSGTVNIELVIIVKIYCLIMIFTIMNVLLNPFVLSMEKYREMRKMYMTIAMLFLIISIPLTFLFKSYGMAVSILFVEVFVFTNSLIITRWNNDENLCSDQYAK